MHKKLLSIQQFPMRNPLLWCVFVPFYGLAVCGISRTSQCPPLLRILSSPIAAKPYTTTALHFGTHHQQFNRIKTYTKITTNFIDNKNGATGTKSAEWKGKQRAQMMRTKKRKKKKIQKILLLLPNQISYLAEALRPLKTTATTITKKEYWPRFRRASHPIRQNADRKSSRVTGLQREAYYLRWPIPNF